MALPGGRDYSVTLRRYPMVEQGWLGIFQIVGALALFIYGIKVMSEGVQRLASLQLREALQRVTQNKVSTFLTGFVTSGLLQSGSAATLLTISFVNAGIITLTAAAGLIIGANAGSAVTIWMLTIFGFEYNLFALCLPMIALAMPFVFLHNGRHRNWAETVIGFSIVLIALQFLKSVVPDLHRHQEIISFISYLGRHGWLSILLFLIIGTLLTSFIQSISAAMALTFTLCLNGWLPFEIAAAMVLGETVGTTLTVEVASWVGNTESRKAARMHVWFNVFGAILFLPLLPIVLSGISWAMVYMFKTGNPVVDKWAMPAGLAFFYSVFNLVCAALYLSFMPLFIRLTSGTVKARPGKTDSLNFIDMGSHSADLSLPIALQEIIQQCQRLKHLNGMLNRIINFTSDQDFQEFMAQAQDYQAKLNVNHKATTQYLIGLVEDRSSQVTSMQIKSLLNINLLIDHITGLYAHVYMLVQEKRKQRVWFGPTQRSTLLFRINDAEVMLKRCIQWLQSSSFSRHHWKNFSVDFREKKLVYIDYENEMMDELERGEMKLPAVITYYRLAQQLDQINTSLRTILNELSQDDLT